MSLGRLHTDHAHALRRVGTRHLLVIAAAVVVLLALVAGGTYALLNQGKAAVLITPASSTVNTSYTILGVTGAPDVSQNQVSTRLLSTNTPAQTKTVKASGHLSAPATPARGTMILRNWDSAPKTFQAGTVLPDWSADLVVNCGNAPDSIVLDATITVPAAPTLGKFGVANAPAHIMEPGSGGNIPGPLGTNSCVMFLWAQGTCDPGYYHHCWTIAPAGQFTGGQDAYDGPMVQQSDIDNAANRLISANQPTPQRALQRQMQPGEQFLGTPQCVSHITPYQQAGAKAKQVTVSAYFTCTGQVYDQQETFALATSMLTAQAGINPGKRYTLVGSIKTALSSVMFTDQGTLRLTISATGVWVYQFTDAQKQRLASLLAGKSRQEAVQLASSQPGVAYVTVYLLANQQRLPSAPQQMSVLIQALPGA
jgi:hypothetical protein